MDILTGATSVNLAIGDALNALPLCTGLARQTRTKSPVINAERIVVSSPWNKKPDDRLEPQEREDFTEYMRHERWCEFMSGIQKEGATIDRAKLAEFGDPNGELYRVTEERKEIK